MEIYFPGKMKDNKQDLKHITSNLLRIRERGHLEVKCRNTIFSRNIHTNTYFIKSSHLLSSREKPSPAVTLIFTHIKRCLRLDHEIKILALFFLKENDSLYARTSGEECQVLSFISFPIFPLTRQL